MDRAVVLPLKPGELPPYDKFVRHIWWYMAHGDSALCPPPDMFTLPIDDRDDMRVVGQEAARCLRDFEFAQDRIEVIVGDGHQRIVFRDLEVLHTFLRLMAQRAVAGDAAATEVVAFALSMLGFQWRP